MSIELHHRCLKGYGSLTYFLVFLNIAATIVARGLVVAAYADLMRHADAAYVTLISLCFLPQFIHVSKCKFWPVSVNFGQYSLF